MESIKDLLKKLAEAEIIRQYLVEVTNGSTNMDFETWCWTNS